MTTQVTLQTEKGKIQGQTSFNHTGNQKNLIMVEFEYNERKYKMPFSRKTGKLYNVKLAFDVRLIIN